MERTHTKYCVNSDCSEAWKSLPVAHTILGTEKKEGMTADWWRLRCPHCLSEHLEVVPRTRVKKKSWPYYNSSVGGTFESESHEKDFVKKNNLVPL